jgi:hypothetical protein
MICFRNEYPVYSSLLIFEFFTNNDYRVGDKKTDKSDVCINHSALLSLLFSYDLSRRSLCCWAIACSMKYFIFTQISTKTKVLNHNMGI